MTQENVSATKKDKILKCALDLFAERGFHATTTKQIAERSGVAEGLIFYYFGGKRELLQHVIRSFSFFEAARAGEDMLDALDGEEALLEYGRLYVSFLDRHESFLLLIWSPELMNDPDVSAEVSKLLNAMAEQTARLLLRALRGKEPGPKALEAAANMLLSSLLTYKLIRTRSDTRRTEEDEDYVREVTGIVLRGLGLRN